MQQHRHALGEEERREEVPALALPQRAHGVVVGGALDAAVPGVVVVGAVLAALAVGLVVLLVVRDEVGQGEPVVRGDEVDRRVGPAAVVLVEVRRAREPGRELAERPGGAAPEVADRVAVLAVPLGPPGREVAHLVAAGPDVPRLGDELDLRDHRVLLDEVEEGGQPVDVVELAGQRRGEVEAEAVDVHLGHPVPQRVHDQLQRVGLADVQRVPGAGVVHVVLRLVLDEAVVGLVVDAAHGQRRALVVALGGVVVDDVEDHLDAGRVQVADHRLELLHVGARRGEPRRAGARVPEVRGEEGDRVVAPVVAQPALHEGVVVDELMDRHELDRGDPEALQVRDGRRVRDRRVRAAHLLGDLGVQVGQALDVRLVDDGLVVRRAGRTVVVPVEERVHDDGLGHVLCRVVVVDLVGVVEVVAEQRLVPGVGGAQRAVDRLGVGVDQQLVRVAALPLLGVERAVDAVAVALPGDDAGQVAVPDEPVALGQRDAVLLAVGIEQAEGDRGRHLAEQREVRPGAVVRGTEGVGRARPGLHRLSFVSWVASVRRPAATLPIGGRGCAASPVRPAGR